jgi:hypothetical protein
MNILNHTIFNGGHAGFLWSDVDEDLFFHWGALFL